MRWETCWINTLHCDDDDGKANVAISRFSCCITPVSTNVNLYLQKSDSHSWEVGTFITPRFTRKDCDSSLRERNFTHHCINAQAFKRTNGGPNALHTYFPSTRVAHLGLKMIRVLRIYFLLSFYPTPTFVSCRVTSPRLVSARSPAI